MKKILKFEKVEKNMKYEINSKKIHNLSAIPFEVTKYLKEVSGENLKVLFLIFSEKKTLSSFEIATKLEITTLQAEEAIRFWKFKGILKLPEEDSAIIKIEKPSIDQITTKELIAAKKENELVDMLFKEAEMLYKRPLRPIERRSLLYIFEFYKLPVDVILMVVDFCVRYNKSLKQTVVICEDMSDNDITSHEQTEKYIKNLTEKFNIENQIKNCFGIYNRKLSSNEKKYIFKWTKKYCFKINIIKLAFNICVDKTGKLSFQYIEKILQNWKKNNIKTEEDVEKLNSNIKNSKTKNNKNTSYDLDELLSKNPLYIKE